MAVTIAALMLALSLVGSTTSLPDKTQAQHLAQVMAQKQLDAFAVADPADDQRFVAVMFYPGQLLLISGRYSLPNDLRYYLREKNYKQVYSSLYAAAERDGRLFVQDMGADGLPAAKGDGVDVVYERGETQTVFDRPASAKGKGTYDTKYADISQRYADALSLLLAQLTASS